MPGIKHSISIGAEPHFVYPLVASGQGFARWWASDVTEAKPGGNVELGFFQRATVYGLKPIQLVAPRQAHWLCQTGKEWAGTRLLFDLAPDGKNTLLRFTHRLAGRNGLFRLVYDGLARANVPNQSGGRRPHSRPAICRRRPGLLIERQRAPDILS